MDLLTAYVLSIIGQILVFFLIVVVIIVAVSVLVTDRGIVKPMKRLERRAYRDTLTGLQNRTAYYEYNQVLDGHISEGAASFSILMVDVNFLKRMNDTHGHEKGNVYLKNASDLIGSVFGRDYVYRTGGDEFVVVMEGERQKNVDALIRQFKSAVEFCKSAAELELSWSPDRGSPRRSALPPMSQVGTAAPRTCSSGQTPPCTRTRWP